MNASCYGYVWYIIYVSKLSYIHILYIFFSLAVLWMRVVIIYCIYFQSGCIVDASCNHILYISSVWLYCGCEL